MYREDGRAFESDAIALNVAKDMIRRGEDRKLKPIERVFIYLPLEHSEEADDQALSVEKFREVVDQVSEELKDIYRMFLDYAARHKVIIERFGRFPHRNDMIGRKSTREELEFLKQPNSLF